MMIGRYKYDSTFWWCFLLGLGMHTQIYVFGCVGISELFMFFIAPYYFIKDIKDLLRDGFGPIIWLFVFAALSMICSSLINNAPTVAIYKFLASIYSTLCALVLFHRSIKKNPYSVGGYLLGFALSCVISVFIFHPVASLEAGQLDAEITVQDQMSGVLFWVSKIQRFLMIPISLFYLRLPSIVISLTIFAYTVFCMMTTVSGRAAALTSIGAIFLVLWGRRSRVRMKGICKHFLLFCVLSAGALVIFKNIYSFSAKNGYLGIEAEKKYIYQTQQGEGLLRLLMGGRAEFFVGLDACLDKPLLGWGAFPEDGGAHWYEFLVKYGNYSDFENFIRAGINKKAMMIPEHAHLTVFWLRCGLPGLILWVYVLWLIFIFMKKYLYVIPQLFGFFVFMLPGFVWDIFFTPYNKRVQVGIILAGMLVARAIALGRFRLPVVYELEAKKYE